LVDVFDLPVAPGVRAYDGRAEQITVELLPAQPNGSLDSEDRGAKQRSDQHRGDDKERCRENQGNDTDGNVKKALWGTT
jgi:hypothetical protein